MTITKFTRFLDDFLETKEAALGRLVLDVKNPGLSFRESSTLALTFDKDIARRTFRSAQTLTNASSSSKFSALLSKFVSLFVSSSGEASDDIATPMAITYQLQNTADVFERVCTEESVQKWLVKAIEHGKDVFFLTGYHTLRNASVNTAAREEHAFGASVQAPITATVSQGVSEALPPGIGDAMDVRAQGEGDRRLDTAAAFTSLGERVVAIQYQKLEFKPFRSKIVGAAQLGKVRWEVLSKDRGAAEQEGLEASLSAIEESKLQRACGGAVEMSVTPGGEVFVIDEKNVPR